MIFSAPHCNESPYPSLSDFHDYEPGLEFDDAELWGKKLEVGEGGMLVRLFIFFGRGVIIATIYWTQFDTLKY